MPESERAGQSHQRNLRGQAGDRDQSHREPSGAKAWSLSKPNQVSDKREQESKNKIILSDTREQEQVEGNTFWPAIPGSMWWRTSRESAGEQTEPSRRSIPETRGSGSWSLSR